MDRPSLAKYNKGNKYVLAVIDVFSKYGWLVPLKDKRGVTIATELKKIIKTSGRSPNKLWVEKGKEFYNKNVKELAELYSKMTKKQV